MNTVTLKIPQMNTNNVKTDIQLKYHIVIVTTAGKGHLLPMLSLADTMISVDTAVCVSIVVPQAPGIDIPESGKSNVRVVPFSIPAESQGPGMTALLWLAEHEDFLGKILHGILDEMQLETAPFPRPRFLLYDMFATYTQDIAYERNLPHGLCGTSPLPFLYAWVHRCCLAPPHLICKDPNPIHLPGLGDLPKSAMPDDSTLPDIFEKVVNRFATTKVALVNDCELLYCPSAGTIGDRSPLATAAEFAITGTGERTPVYCTGVWASRDARLRGIIPVIEEEDVTSVDNSVESTECSTLDVKEEDPVFAWLNKQEHDSVVFVALGSWCPMPAPDVCELARGLEQCGHPFLWAYRPNLFNLKPPHSPKEWVAPEARDKLCENGLPVGFEESVAGRSFVARWVDQPRILTHPAIACFVTHCGWNSLTEALTLSGKPLIALPLGAEQHMNAWVMTELLKLGKRLWEPEWPRSLDRDDVSRVINEVLNNDELKVHVKDISKQIRSSWNENNDGYSAKETRRFFKNHIY